MKTTIVFAILLSLAVSSFGVPYYNEVTYWEEQNCVGFNLLTIWTRNDSCTPTIDRAVCTTVDEVPTSHSVSRQCWERPIKELSGNPAALLLSYTSNDCSGDVETSIFMLDTYATMCKLSDEEGSTTYNKITCEDNVATYHICTDSQCNSCVKTTANGCSADPLGGSTKLTCSSDASTLGKNLFVGVLALAIALFHL